MTRYGAGSWPSSRIRGILLNSGLGVWQERKAEAALAKLFAMAAPQVWTLRDGRFVRLPSRELVPGDVVRLEAGDRVPADGVVIDAVSLSVDESVVTDSRSAPSSRMTKAAPFGPGASRRWPTGCSGRRSVRPAEAPGGPGRESPRPE